MSEISDDDSGGAASALQTPLSLGAMYRLFDQEPPSAREVGADQLPEAERSLLAHEGHMTVTLERHYGCRVTLEVLDQRLEEPLYARKILLRQGPTGDAPGQVVQFGLMRFDFRHCSRTVREEIVAQSTPLGRILIEHGTLRRVTVHALLEIDPSTEIAATFEGTGAPRISGPVYGRLATIHVDRRPAVALLEVVCP